MASEMVEKKATKPQQRVLVPQQTVVEQDPLPCPRCESTNTKFCYYNNYNFSQPRHFCKACRRYWTHGGTLRDIPIGGATRNKTAKRSRSSSSPSSSSSLLPILVSESSTHPPPVAGVSFTSLLSNAGGFGFGFGFDDVGFGLQFGSYGRVNGFAVGGVNGDHGNVNREDTWQPVSGEHGGDCFSYLPELSISSTHGNGMK